MTALGTATPTPAEWPALRAAWALGTVCAAHVERGGRLLLSRMERRGLLRREAPGTYTATHSRATMAAYVLGEE